MPVWDILRLPHLNLWDTLRLPCNKTKPPQTNWKTAVEFDPSLKSSQTTQTKRILRKLWICLSNNALQDTWCWEQGHELHCAASKYQQATPGNRIWPNGRNLQFPLFEMGKSMAAWWWGLQTVCFRKENRSASWQNANSLGKITPSSMRKISSLIAGWKKKVLPSFGHSS